MPNIKSLARIFIAIIIGLALGLAAHSFAKPKPKQSKNDDKKTYQELALFADILKRVEDNYVEETKPEELTSDAINGLLHALDPHSRYDRPQDFAKLQKRAKREYGGLGIEVTLGDDGLVHIGYVNPGGPAFRAGLKRGDKISRVKGKKIKGKTLDEAVKEMRGLAGDPITISVISPGRAEREITIIREVIRGRAVRHRMHEGMGYIYLETFSNENATRDVREALRLLKKENKGELEGLVFDLRGNGGGFLLQSVSIAGLFLDGGEIVSVRGRKKEEHDRYHAKEGVAYSGPLIVLTNQGTASASEIVAGALQDRGRALILGTKTFGKGSVQSVIPLNNGRRGALRLTTARYFTPSGRSIQGLGIMPDLWVEPFPDNGKKRIRIYESSLPHALDKIIIKTEGENQAQEKPKPVYPPKDWPEDKDFQLEEAVKLLKSGDFAKKLQESFGE